MSDIAPPTLAETLKQEMRLLLDVATLLTNRAPLATAPCGKNEPVFVLPGLATSDRSTFVLRRFLNKIGYRAQGWGLGINHGDARHLLETLKPLIKNLAQKNQTPITLIGWSLGGLLAREIARADPESVRRVITLGTPVIGGGKYTFVARSMRRKGINLDALERELHEINHDKPITVPVAALYSKRDGIVAWRACLDPNPDNRVTHTEVACAHLGFGFHTAVLRKIADLLAEMPS